MKATVWLWPFVTTLLCASQFVYTAQREFQDFPDSNWIQDSNAITKRTKPSLSINDSLNILRQKLLLEMARRQMRENAKQIERNREILRNIGKRNSHNDLLDLLQRQDDEVKDFNDDEFKSQYLFNSLHSPNQYTRK